MVSNTVGVITNATKNADYDRFLKNIIDQEAKKNDK